MESFKILSLDGGGTWALIQVRILQQKHGIEVRGHDVLRYYDLVIANSGGTLVLAAMCMNKTLSEIAQLFLNPAILETIFDKKPLQYYVPVLKRFLPRFKTTSKLEGLKKQLTSNISGLDANVLLTDLPKMIGKPNLQLIITCFDYDKKRAVYLRSNPFSNMESCNIQQQIGLPVTPTFKTTSLLHAAHGSTNAPVLFFDDPAKFPFSGENYDHRYWDGAVAGNNNPIAVGVLEAIANGAKKENIKAVSIGTANTCLPVLYNIPGEPRTEFDWLVKYCKTNNWIGDLRKMANSILEDPPDAATFMAFKTLDLQYSKEPGNQLIRINPVVKPIYDPAQNAWRRPGINWKVKDLKYFFEMDMAVTTAYGVNLIDKLCEDYFAGAFDNQGIRNGGPLMEIILGHRTFKDALDAWNSW
jgi:hypothetical protein